MVFEWFSNSFSNGLPMGFQRFSNDSVGFPVIFLEELLETLCIRLRNDGELLEVGDGGLSQWRATHIRK